MSDLLTNLLVINNSYDISDVRRQQDVQMRLTEFNERVNNATRNGSNPTMGFFEFERANPTAQQPNPSGKWVGALIGGLIGLALGFEVAPVAIPLAGAAGFAIGSFAKEPESKRLTRAMNKYDTYLTQAEMLGQGHARAMPFFDMGGPEVKRDHAASLLTDRALGDQAIGRQ